MAAFGSFAAGGHRILNRKRRCPSTRASVARHERNQVVPEGVFHRAEERKQSEGKKESGTVGRAGAKVAAVAVAVIISRKKNKMHQGADEVTAKLRSPTMDEFFEIGAMLFAD